MKTRIDSQGNTIKVGDWVGVAPSGDVDPETKTNWIPDPKKGIFKVHSFTSMKKGPGKLFYQGATEKPSSYRRRSSRLGTKTCTHWAHRKNVINKYGNKSCAVLQSSGEKLLTAELSVVVKLLDVKAYELASLVERNDTKKEVLEDVIRVWKVEQQKSDGNTLRVPEVRD